MVNPFFYYILDSLKEVKYIDEVIINTDSIKIADMAKKIIMMLQFNRSKHLLKINSNEANLIIDDSLRRIDCDFFIQTHSTNPLLKSSTIDNSIETYFNQEKYDSLFSVTKYQNRLFFKDGKPVNHNPEEVNKNSRIRIFI